MSSTRLPPLLSSEEAQQRASAVGIPARLAGLNIFRMLLHQPRAARALADLILELLAGRALDHRLRELVIMRLGWTTDSDYEWSQHWEIAQQVFGLQAEDLLAVKDWQTSGRFGEAERVVLSATDETLAGGAIASETADHCLRVLGDQAVIELVLTIGVWRTISEVTRSLGVALEEGMESWPPDGTSPTGLG